MKNSAEAVNNRGGIICPNCEKKIYGVRLPAPIFKAGDSIKPQYFYSLLDGVPDPVGSTGMVSACCDYDLLVEIKVARFV